METTFNESIISLLESYDKLNTIEYLDYLNASNVNSDYIKFLYLFH